MFTGTNSCRGETPRSQPEMGPPLPATSRKPAATYCPQGYTAELMTEQIDSVGALEEKLSEILVNGSLYRRFVYQGKDCHGTYSGGARYGTLPGRLKMFCDNERCKSETWWDTKTQTFLFAGFIKNTDYTCRNCGKSTVFYYFVWQERETHNVFLKVGQYPELEERVPESLAAALGATDLKLYKNALRMRNFNLGLAAVAYMRRVVENRMGDMLEILHEAAVAHNAPPELLKRHEEMKKEKRFAVKIEYAGDLLPANLRPSGKPNPMAILHELASEGLHAKSDEECVDIFDKCRTTFEYVFGKMRIETEDAKNFVKSMAGLAEAKVKAEAKPGSNIKVQ